MPAALTGYSGSDKRIIRIGHNQTTDHPTSLKSFWNIVVDSAKMGGMVVFLIGLLLVTYVSALSMGLPSLAGLV